MILPFEPVCSCPHIPYTVTKAVTVVGTAWQTGEGVSLVGGFPYTVSKTVTQVLLEPESIEGDRTVKVVVKMGDVEVGASMDGTEPMGHAEIVKVACGTTKLFETQTVVVTVAVGGLIFEEFEVEEVDLPDPLRLIRLTQTCGYPAQTGHAGTLHWQLHTGTRYPEGFMGMSLRNQKFFWSALMLQPAVWCKAWKIPCGK